MFAYTADELRRLQPGRGLAQVLCPLSTTTRHRLQSLGLRRRRGTRAGRNKQRSIDVIALANHRSLSRLTRPIQRTRSPNCQTRRIRAPVTRIVDQSSDRQSTLIHVKCVCDPSTVRVLVGSLNVQSIGGKSAVLSDFINNFDIFAAVETWHDSANCPNVIASTPPGYRCVEKARSRANTDSDNVRTNYGGICLFLKECYLVREIALPSYDSTEVLAVFVQGAGIKLLLVVLYRPGTTHVTTAFINDLADIVERSAVYAAPLIIAGDINVHLDDVQSSFTTSVVNIFVDADLVQHVSEPTHRPAKGTKAHTIDIFVTQRAMNVSV